MRREFFRRSPRSIKRLWYLIASVACAEILLLIVAIRAGDDWVAIAWQLCSLSIPPLVTAALVAIAISLVANRRLQSRETRSNSDDPEIPYEIAAARSVAKVIRSATRTKEGKAAVRLAARLTVAAQAAMRPPPSQEEARGPQRERFSDSR